MRHVVCNDKKNSISSKWIGWRWWTQNMMNGTWNWNMWLIATSMCQCVNWSLKHQLLQCKEIAIVMAISYTGDVSKHFYCGTVDNRASLMQFFLLSKCSYISPFASMFARPSSVSIFLFPSAIFSYLLCWTYMLSDCLRSFLSAGLSFLL